MAGGQSDVALSYGLGGGIGLDLEQETPYGRPGGHGGDPRRASVLALQVITGGPGGFSCAGDTICLEDRATRRW